VFEGIILKIENLVSTLQVCLDSGVKKVLFHEVTMMDLVKLHQYLILAFWLVPYSDLVGMVFKALVVE